MNLIQKSIAQFIGLDKYVNPIYFERYSSRFIDPITDFNEFHDDIRKLEIVFSNPAVLKVFSLCCDMFSMGKVYVYQNGKALKSDPFLDLLKNPNPFQQRNQLLWDYMFYKMIGNAYGYVDSKIVTNDKNKIYFLDPSKMTFPVEMMKLKDVIALSESTVKTINNFNIGYKYSSGETTSFKWDSIIHIPDLSNGIGNWFRGRSKIDALYKVICNSEAALDSKNINIRFAGKYMVAGKADPNNVTQLPLGETEKEDIETKMNGIKNVHAVKSMIDIKRFVENIGNLKLDEAYMTDYFIIGSMYGIPKDVLEALNSGTYENQEKARGSLVSYSLSPSGEQLTTAFENKFGYTDKTIVIDWEHLQFMQVFAKERAETDKTKAETLLILMKAGVNLEQINSMLDLELTEIDYEAAQRTFSSGQTNGNSSTN